MTLRLATDAAEVHVDPARGAGILRYRLASGRDVLMPTPDDQDSPTRTACFLMAPWCNRIRHGVIGADGTHHPIEPVLASSPVPIHGTAVHADWTVVDHGAQALTLTARCTGPEPFDFDATVRYALAGAVLDVTLSVTHRGAQPCPYGLGLHPWMPRTGAVTLAARADTYQAVDKDMLPIGDVAVTTRPAWDFTTARALPEDLIDTAFGGWDGRATLSTPEGPLAITTDPPLGHYQVYSPGADAPFFCFEPVMHPVDAHNRPDHPGLVTLAAGASTAITVCFDPT